MYRRLVRCILYRYRLYYTNSQSLIVFVKFLAQKS